MKIALIMTALLVATEPTGLGQGLFEFNNNSARTRVGSIDGPLAGSGIWGQMLAGSAPDSLVPVGLAVEHSPLGIGLVYGGIVSVPGIRDCQFAYLQMVAWDGAMWGTSLAAVPASQLGRTDTVPVLLGGASFPCESIPIPFFRQPAVVPVPEPSGLAITVVCGLLALGFHPVRMRLGRASCGVTRRAEK